MSPDNDLRPGDRLGKDTGEVFRKGARDFSGPIGVYYLAGDRPRFAAVAGKKTGKSHERNLLKRRAREIFRKNKQRLENYSIAVLFRPGSAETDYKELEKTLETIWKENSLLTK